MQDQFEAAAGEAPRRVRTCLLPACMLAVGLLAACGSGSSPGVPASPAASLPPHGSHVEAVAHVAGTPIPKASYAHWRSVEARLGAAGDAGHQALGFLLTSQWVLDEAAARGVSASEAEIKSYLAQLERQRFPRAGMLAQFLKQSGQTGADLLARARVELQKERLAAKLSAASSGAHTSRLLASFERSFHSRWRSRTTCGPAYVMEDCSEYRGKGENLTAKSGPAARVSRPAGSSSSAPNHATPGPRPANGSHTHKTPTLNTEQELPPARPGQMALSSPAFELNGAIPAQYTCDGAGTSPPLHWQDVPKNAASLILYVIDDETPGAGGGIRWVVGDIDPHSTGVAAGQTPQGAVVGANAQGHTGYGAICPAHGATSRIEFVMLALSKRIPLTTGFQPSAAADAYGTQKLRIGKAAITYAGYHRP